MQVETTQYQLNNFHEFALARLTNGGSTLTIEELFEEWQLSNSTPAQHLENCKAIASSLKDFDNGARGQEATEFQTNFRSRNGIQ